MNLQIISGISFQISKSIDRLIAKTAPPFSFQERWLKPVRKGIWIWLTDYLKRVRHFREINCSTSRLWGLH